MSKMEREVFDEKTEELLCAPGPNNTRSRYTYLALYPHPEPRRLFCVVCVCFANNSARSSLVKSGLELGVVSPSVIKRSISEHESTAFHKKSTEEYVLNVSGSAPAQVQSAVEIDVGRNRHIVDSVICAVIHLISHGKFIYMVNIADSHQFMKI